ncbi:MAG: hypothetical protein AAB038_04160 [Planctomycetota bacterium]
MTENNKAGWFERYPFLTATIIMFAMFYFSHFTLSQAYKLGEKGMLGLVITVGIFYGFLALVFLYAGIKGKTPLWQNILGLCAGVCWWDFYGEMGDTLQADFGVTTGVSIGYGNIPFLVILGVIFILAIRYKAIAHPAILQWANFAYINWFGHVILLTVYYAPIFGGETPELGIKADCWDVWSGARLTTTFVIWGIYLLILLPLVLFKFRRSENMQLKIASAFWFVILFWSSFVEIPKKLVYMQLW